MTIFLVLFILALSYYIYFLVIKNKFQEDIAKINRGEFDEDASEKRTKEWSNKFFYYLDRKTNAPSKEERAYWAKMLDNLNKEIYGE